MSTSWQSHNLRDPRGDPITIHKHLKCENNKQEQESLILVPNVLLALQEGIENNMYTKTIPTNTTHKNIELSILFSSQATISNSILCTNSFLAILELSTNILLILSKMFPSEFKVVLQKNARFQKSKVVVVSGETENLFT